MVGITWNSPAQYGRQVHSASDRMAGTVPVWKASSQVGASSADVSAKISQSLATDTPHKNNPGQAPSLSFGEIVDIINPLQHIPVVNSVYRNMTGDEISSVAQIAGGALYGGAVGGVVSLVNAAMKEHSGQDFATAFTSGFRGEAADKYFYQEERTAGIRAFNEKREPDDQTRVNVSEQTDAGARLYNLNA